MITSVVSRFNAQEMPRGDRQRLLVDVQVVVEAGPGDTVPEMRWEAVRRILDATERNLNVQYHSIEPTGDEP